MALGEHGTEKIVRYIRDELFGKHGSSDADGKNQD